MKSPRLRNSLALRRGLRQASAGRRFYSPSSASLIPPNLRHEYSVASPVEEKDGREHVVILGSGWAGYVLSRQLSPSKFRTTVISPRSYFVFTPLLNDCAVGTLEFRNVLESVRKKNSKVDFLQGWADDVNFKDKTITVEPSVLDPDVGHALTGPRREKNEQLVQYGGTSTVPVQTFEIRYDKLVIAVGCYSQTFNTPGVRENALFLKDVGDARKIRRRILELFELAALPVVPEETKRYLLHFAIVGGGPTGMEFAAQLSDLIRDDLSKMYPKLQQYIKISLLDVAPKVLPMFDASLADYAVKTYARQNIEIKTSHHVELLRKGFPDDPEAVKEQDGQVKGRVYTLRTKEEGDVGIGMCVWSTGNMMNPFVQKALNHVRRYPTSSAELITSSGDTNTSNAVGDDTKSWIIKRNPRTGAILVDDRFRVQLQTTSDPEAEKPKAAEAGFTAKMTDVFAIGDTAAFEPGPLPATAQVANQQALWLAKRLNAAPSYTSPSDWSRSFSFRNLGVMTYLGGAKALLQGPSMNREGKARGLKGWVAFLLWRGAYLTMTLSWRNKFLVPVQWMAVRLFGRDISRF